MIDLEAVRGAAEPVLTRLGLELVDAQMVGTGRARTLRLSVDRPGGVDLEALADATGPVSAALDEAAAVSGSYHLEVSSPGLERPLRRPGDFSRFVGTTITLKSHEPLSGARRHRGRLLEVDEEGIALDVEGEHRRFPFTAIASARTVFEWGSLERPGKVGVGTRRAGGAPKGRTA